ncbi:MAG: hypothetical protein QXU98_14630, partial [Candidatus Parvarchaeota archaeon]
RQRLRLWKPAKSTIMPYSRYETEKVCGVVDSEGSISSHQRGNVSHPRLIHIWKYRQTVDTKNQGIDVILYYFLLFSSSS